VQADRVVVLPDLDDLPNETLEDTDVRASALLRRRAPLTDATG
jgi:hypothetical protein